MEVVNREGGVDMAVDHIGGSYLARAFKCLRPEGTLVSTSSYAAALGRSGMLEAVGGLIRLLNTLIHVITSIKLNTGEATVSGTELGIYCMATIMDTVSKRREVVMPSVIRSGRPRPPPVNRIILSSCFNLLRYQCAFTYWLKCSKAEPVLSLWEPDT